MQRVSLLTVDILDPSRKRSKRETHRSSTITLAKSMHLFREVFESPRLRYKRMLVKRDVANHPYKGTTPLPWVSPNGRWGGVCRSLRILSGQRKFRQTYRLRELLGSIVLLFRLVVLIARDNRRLGRRRIRGAEGRTAESDIIQHCQMTIELAGPGAELSVCCPRYHCRLTERDLQVREKKEPRLILVLMSPFPLHSTKSRSAPHLAFERWSRHPKSPE